MSGDLPPCLDSKKRLILDWFSLDIDTRTRTKVNLFKMAWKGHNFMSDAASEKLKKINDTEIFWLDSRDTKEEQKRAVMWHDNTIVEVAVYSMVNDSEFNPPAVRRAAAETFCHRHPDFFISEDLELVIMGLAKTLKDPDPVLVDIVFRALDILCSSFNVSELKDVPDVIADLIDSLVPLADSNERAYSILEKLVKLDVGYQALYVSLESHGIPPKPSRVISRMFQTFILEFKETMKGKNLLDHGVEGGIRNFCILFGRFIPCVVDEILVGNALKIMDLFYHVFNSCYFNVEVRLAAVGFIIQFAQRIGTKFQPYIKKLFIYVGTTIMNLPTSPENEKAFALTLKVAGDLALALSKSSEIRAYCDPVMLLLIRHLPATKNVQLKSRILFCLTDFAEALKVHFKDYLQQVVKCLHDAAVYCHGTGTTEDDEHGELDDLKIGMLQLILGILRGLISMPHLLEPLANDTLTFIKQVATPLQSDKVKETAVKTLGRLAFVGEQVRNIIKNGDDYRKVIIQCLESDDPKLRATGLWAERVISDLL